MRNWLFPALFALTLSGCATTGSERADAIDRTQAANREPVVVEVEVPLSTARYKYVFTRQEAMTEVAETASIPSELRDQALRIINAKFAMLPEKIEFVAEWTPSEMARKLRVALERSVREALRKAPNSVFQHKNRWRVGNSPNIQVTASSNVLVSPLHDTKWGAEARIKYLKVWRWRVVGRLTKQGEAWANVRLITAFKPDSKSGKLRIRMRVTDVEVKQPYQFRGRLPVADVQFNMNAFRNVLQDLVPRHFPLSPPTILEHRYAAYKDQLRKAKNEARKDIQALIARWERQKEQERIRKEKARIAKLRKQAALFRKNLKVGDDTHCGIVIEVNPPIAKIQTMIGEHWLKIAQLYPKGVAPCRFVNGIYQDYRL